VFRFLEAVFLEVEVLGFEILFLETLDFEIQLQLLLVLLNYSINPFYSTTSYSKTLSPLGMERFPRE